MNVFEAIQQRRSIKRYDASHHMSDAEINQLMQLAMLTPTAFNIQHWRFVLVKDAAQRKQIRQHAWDQVQVTESSLLIVVCADMMAWQKDPARYWLHAPDYPREEIVSDLQAYYANKARVQRDEALRSSSMAAQTIMLAAKGMGYDTCPMDGFDFEKVAQLINLPADHLICMMIAVGKAIAPPRPRGGQITIDEAVITNRFA